MTASASSSSAASADAGTRSENTREETGPAVRNGVVRYVSVSQIQTFDPKTFGGCHRKWWFDKVANFEREETEAQRKGKKIHAEIEHWLKYGEDALSMIARQGKHFFPDRRHYLEKNLLIEHPIGTSKAVHLFDEWRNICARVEANSNDGADVYEAEQWHEHVLRPAIAQVLVIDADVPLIGFIDVVNGSGYWTDNEGVEHKDTLADLEVIDWKTTSSIAEHAKTPEQLVKSVQMVGYAKWSLQVFPELKRIRVSHGNLQTRGCVAEKRTAIIHVDSVDKEWQHAVSTVRTMKHVAREKDVSKVEAHIPSCSAYRGCPYMQQCPKSPEQTLFSMFGFVPDAVQEKLQQREHDQLVNISSKGDKKMGMFDHLMKASGGETKPAETPKPTETKPLPAPAHTETKPAATAGDVASARAQLEAEEAAFKAKQAGEESFGFCAGCGVPLVTTNSSRLPSGERKHIACPKAPAQVLPPDATVPTLASSAEAVPGESILTLPPEVQARAKSHAAAVDAEATAKSAVANMAGAMDAAVQTAQQGTPPGKPEGEGEAVGRKCGNCKEPGHTARTCPKKAAAEGAAAGQVAGTSAQQSLPMQQPQAASEELVRQAKDFNALPLKQRIKEMIHGCSDGRDLDAAWDRVISACRETAAPAVVSTGINLYVDCVVEGVQLTSLDEYIARKNKELAVIAKLPDGLQDVRFAGNDTSLGYRKWVGAMTAMVQHDKPPPGNYSLMFVAEDELKQCVVAALKPHCTVFVRGVR